MLEIGERKIVCGSKLGSLRDGVLRVIEVEDMWDDISEVQLNFDFYESVILQKFKLEGKVFINDDWCLFFDLNMFKTILESEKFKLDKMLLECDINVL